MCQIHNDGPNKHRMPVLMKPSKAIDWIKPDLDQATITDLLTKQIDDASLLAYPVFSIRTNKERPDGLLKTDPYLWPGLPALGMDTISPTLF
jgi:hypothetical protein